MASYCPHCGVPTPDEARFCMKCGRERLPAPEAKETPETPPEQAPPAPKTPPPPAQAPALAPAPAHATPSPTPLAAFLTRTFRGDWVGSVQAALWPVVLLLVGAAALATPAYGQDDDAVFGFTDRLRIALALLLQSVGGGFEFTGREEGPDFGSGSGSDGLSLDSGTDMGTGFGSGSDSTATTVEGTASLHLVPLTMTALWIVALYIGVRVLRTRITTRAAAQNSSTPTPT
ncbi:zinc ribbon domain-containing protein, partial [Streptomyces sp. SID337]